MAEQEIGRLNVKIGVDSTQFQSGIKGINEQFRLLDSQFKAAGGSVKGFTNTIEGLTAKKQMLTEKIRLQNMKLNEMQRELQQTKQQWGENSTQANKLQTVLNNQIGTLNKYEAELKQTESAMNKLGNETQQAATKINKLDRESKQSHSSTGTLTGALGGMKGMLGTLGIAIAGLGLGSMALEAGEAGGAILDLSEKTGLSTDRVQELKYAFEQSGTSIDVLQGAAAKFTKVLSGAEEESKTAVETMQKLGISATDASGGLRKMDDIFPEVLTKLAGMDNETERNALAMKVFGKSALELAPVLNTGKDGIKNFSEEAKKLGLVISKDGIQQLDNFSDSWDAVKKSAEGLGKGLLVDVLPAVNTALDGIKNNMPQLKQSVADGFGFLLNQLTPLKPTLEEAKKSLSTMFTSEEMKTNSQAMLNIFEGLKTSVKNMRDTYLEFAKIVIPIWADSFKYVKDNILPPVMKVIDFFATDIIPKVTKAFKEWMPVIKPILNDLWSIIKIVIDKILLVWNFAWPYIQQILTNVWNTIKGVVDGALQAIKGVISIVLGVITGDWSKAWNGIKDLFSGIWTIIKSLLTGAINSLKIQFSSIYDAISTTLGKVKDTVVEKLEGAWDYIKSIAGKMYDWGVDIIQGLINGIQSKIETVKSTVSTLVDSVKNVITGKNGFWIQSPSKVMEEYGKNIADGLAKGIEENTKNPENATINMADIINSAVQKINESIKYTTDNIKLNFDLWTITNKKLEGSSQALEMQLKSQQEQHSNLTDQIALTGQALIDIITNYGESSNEAMKYKNTLLSLQIEQANLANSIQETTNRMKEQSEAQKGNFSIADDKIFQKVSYNGQMVNVEVGKVGAPERFDSLSTQAQTAIKAISQMTGVDMSVARTLYNQGQQGVVINNTYNSPKALDTSEINRLSNKQAQQLNVGLGRV